MINTVLLLDDNKATNFIHKKFINRSGCAKEVLCFEMGNDALQYLTNFDNEFPELIFVDINMPTMDGWEFFELFNRINRIEKDDCRTILLTTSLSPSDETKIAELESVDDIMLKPLNPESIGYVVKKYF